MQKGRRPEPVVGVLRRGTGSLPGLSYDRWVAELLPRLAPADPWGPLLPPIVNVSAQQTVIDVTHAGELLVA